MLAESDLDQLIESLEWKEFPSWQESIQECHVIPRAGYYSIYKTPFFKPFLKWMEDENVQEMGLMIPSQVGKSQLLLAIALEYARRYSDTLVLYYCPDEELASKISALLFSIIDASPEYEKLIKVGKNGNTARDAKTKNTVRFINGSQIQVLGAGGKTSLVSKTSPIVILDEYARMRSLSKAAGDVFSMAKTRTTSFSYGNRKVIAASTPLEEGETIHKFHTEARQYRWEAPCPKCGEYQFLEFESLKWDKPDQDCSTVILANMIRSGKLDVYYECPHCFHKIRENDKLEMLNNGREVCYGNEHLSEHRVSMHLNGLYSIETWPELVGRFYEAQNDLPRMREFKNQVLAAPWEESLKSKKLKTDNIAVGEYRKGEVPPDTYALVAGLDVQEDRYYSIVLAYTMSKKIYLIDWKETPFKYEDILDPSSYPFRLQDQDYSGHKVDAIMLDTAFNTETMYGLARELDRCQPIRGRNKSSYYSQYSKMSKAEGTNLLLVYKYETNELLEELIARKIFIIPSDTNQSDELLHHLTGVIKRNNDYVDLRSDGRVDYRDAIRYGLAHIWREEWSECVDAAIFKRENSAKIESQKANSLEVLKRFF